jgi:hypothetical protein
VRKTRAAWPGVSATRTDLSHRPPGPEPEIETPSDWPAQPCSASNIAPPFKRHDSIGLVDDSVRRSSIPIPEPVHCERLFQPFLWSERITGKPERGELGKCCLPLGRQSLC